MPSGAYPGPNRYNSTPRKVFDKHVDRMETKRQRDREDHRADMQALIKRLINLEHNLLQLTEQHEDLERHVAAHCQKIDLEEEDTRDS